MNLLLCASMSAVVLAAGTTSPIDEHNWKTHPSLAENRRIFREVQGLEKGRQLESTERSPDDECLNYRGDMTRTIQRDSRGKARKLTLSAGSGDSSVTVDAYYDRSSTLRFIFVSAGAVNDTVYEYRIYFDASGKKIWENRKHVAGPGWTFPSPWPEEYIPRDPEARFASPFGCD